MIDQYIRRERIDWRVAIAEAHADHGQLGIARRINISARVTNHDGVMGEATCFHNRLGEVPRIGLLEGKTVAAANRFEVMRDIQLVEQHGSETLCLVCAHSEDMTIRRKRFEGVLGTRKQMGAFRNTRFVMCEIIFEKTVEPRVRQRHVRYRKGAFQQRPCAGAGKADGVFMRQEGQALTRKNMIQRSENIGRRMGKRAIEIENEGGADHRVRLG